MRSRSSTRFPVLAWALVGALTVVGCSSSATPEGASVAAADPAATETPVKASEAASAKTPAEASEPMRVLVTGFNDWRDLGEPPNLWRCRDNPSCRLLLGEAATAEPSEYAGPLVGRLRAAAPDIVWSFATMPVTWEAFSQVPAEFDVIVNIGLGVYDRFDALQLEAGAYNLRQGTDAAGIERHEPIQTAAPDVLPAPEDSPIAGRLEALAGQRFAGYELVVAEARPANSYLCNETHYSALTALHSGEGELREVYFLHIPYAEDGDYEALAEGVAAVVLRLTGV
jgi:hypothetical protein